MFLVFYLNLCWESVGLPITTIGKSKSRKWQKKTLLNEGKSTFLVSSPDISFCHCKFSCRVNFFGPSSKRGRGYGGIFSESLELGALASKMVELLFSNQCIALFGIRDKLQEMITELQCFLSIYDVWWIKKLQKVKVFEKETDHYCCNACVLNM